MSEVRYRRHINAPPEVVWDLLADHRGMSKWTAVRRAELEREGEPAPNGVGAIRALYAIGPPIREEIVAFEPPSKLEYIVLSGIPVRDYRATALLSPEGTGTALDYSITFTPRFPGVQLGIRASIGGMIKGLTKASEQRSATG